MTSSIAYIDIFVIHGSTFLIDWYIRWLINWLIALLISLLILWSLATCLFFVVFNNPLIEWLISQLIEQSSLFKKILIEASESSETFEDQNIDPRSKTLLYVSYGKLSFLIMLNKNIVIDSSVTL